MCRCKRLIALVFKWPVCIESDKRRPITGGGAEYAFLLLCHGCWMYMCGVEFVISDLEVAGANGWHAARD